MSGFSGFAQGLFGGAQAMQGLLEGNQKLNAGVATEQSAAMQRDILNSQSDTDDSAPAQQATPVDTTVPYVNGQPQSPTSGANPPGSEISDGTTNGPSVANSQVLTTPTKSIPGAIQSAPQNAGTFAYGGPSSGATPSAPVASADTPTIGGAKPNAMMAAQSAQQQGALPISTAAPAASSAAPQTAGAPGSPVTTETAPYQPPASTDDPTSGLSTATLTGIAAGFGGTVKGVTPEQARAALKSQQSQSLQDTATVNADGAGVWSPPAPTGPASDPTTGMPDQALMAIATGANPSLTIGQGQAKAALIARHPELAPQGQPAPGATPTPGAAPAPGATPAPQGAPAQAIPTQAAAPSPTDTSAQGPVADATQPAAPSIGQRLASVFVPSAAAGTLPPNMRGSNVPAGQSATQGGATPTSPAGATSGGAVPALTPGSAPLGAVPTAPIVPRASAPVATASPSAQPPKAAAGSPVQVPASTAPVAPGQASPTTQSEPSPAVITPPLDPRPFAALSPAYQGMINQVAQKIGIPPQDLAVAWSNEGSLRTQVADNPKTGAVSPFQVLPATAKTLDPSGTLNPRKLEDAATLSAMYLKQGAAIYGASSPGEFLYYHNGPAGAENYIKAVHSGASPADLEKQFPETTGYLAKAFPGQQLGPNNFTPGIKLDTTALTQAGVTGGPDGFIHFLAQSAPSPGVPMGNMWRAAEGQMAYARILNGDPDGAAHAVAFAGMMSQQGYVQNIGKALQALQGGDSTSAAQLLARANAFFPDGAMGRFGVDKSGNLWGQQMSEKDPNVALTPAFPITADHLMQQVTIAQNPTNYVQALQAAQAKQAQSYEQIQHGQYFANQPAMQQQAREFAASQSADARRAASVQSGINNTNTNNTRLAQTTVTAAQKDASDAAKTAGKPDPNMPVAKEVDKETTQYFPQPAPGPNGQVDPKALNDNALASDAYSALRLSSPPGSMNPVKAHALASGVLNGSYVARPTSAGTFAIVDPKNPTTALGIVPGGVGQRLAARSQIGSRAAPPQAPAQPTPSAIPSLAPQYTAHPSVQPAFALPTTALPTVPVASRNNSRGY